MEMNPDRGFLEIRVVAEQVAVGMDECLEHDGEFFAENVVSNPGKQVQQEMPAADVAVHVERHLASDFLPLRHHFVPLESVVPSLQLGIVYCLGNGKGDLGSDVTMRKSVSSWKLSWVFLFIYS